MKLVNFVVEKVKNALKSVGLNDQKFAQRKWHELSGGEAQRVAMAAGLILKPEVLLLNEPIASVDTESAELIRKASLNARKNWGTTLVIVSHDLQWLSSISDKQLGSQVVSQAINQSDNQLSGHIVSMLLEKKTGHVMATVSIHDLSFVLILNRDQITRYGVFIQADKLSSASNPVMLNGFNCCRHSVQCFFQLGCRASEI